jgi:hypothetical protein
MRRSERGRARRKDPPRETNARKPVIDARIGERAARDIGRDGG